MNDNGNISEFVGCIKAMPRENFIDLNACSRKEEVS